MEPSLTQKTDSSLSHETVVEGMLLCAIAMLRDNVKTIEITDWMTQVRDAIKFYIPDYHYIICKYPLEFTDYSFEDAVLEWCYTVKDHRFRVFVFREGVINDYKEPENITEFYYGGTGKIERAQKNLNADSQPFWSNQIVYELRFEGKVFDKDAWIEFIYKYFETHLPGLNTNPQQYMFAGRYPEYCQNI